MKYGISKRVLDVIANACLYVKYRIALRYYLRDIQKFPNIFRPGTYNEKMFWRRIFDHNPKFADCCDKLRTKEIFHAHGVTTPQTLWSGTNINDIPDALRQSGTIVKHNASSGTRWRFAIEGNDFSRLDGMATDWMTTQYGKRKAEWAYQGARNLLFAEEMITADGEDIIDLKFHMFGSRHFYTVVYVGEKTGRSLSGIFDKHGTRLGITNSVVQKDPSRALPDTFVVPASYAQMLSAAEAIAADFDYMRVDFMTAGSERFYGSELTPYPVAGLMTNSSPESMAELSAAWDIRQSWFLRTTHRGWRGKYAQALRLWLSAG